MADLLCLECVHCETVRQELQIDGEFMEYPRAVLVCRKRGWIWFPSKQAWDAVGFFRARGLLKQIRRAETCEEYEEGTDGQAE